MADFLKKLPDGASGTSLAQEAVGVGDLNRVIGVLNGTDGPVGANFFALNPPIVGPTIATVIGDGTTVETASIQAPLTAGGWVRVPLRGSGVCLIDAPLVIKSNSRLELADGVTVRLKSGSNCNMLNNPAVTAARSVKDGVATAASATLTSATAAFASPADDNAQVVVWGAGPNGTPLVTTMTVVNATTATLAIAASTSVAIAAVSIGPRDSNIIVEGGFWDGNGNIGAVGPLQHMLRFRRLDGLTLRNFKTTGTIAGYSVAPGDVTELTIENVNGSTSKGQIQINGPARNVRCRNISGGSGDDLLAFTCNDYATYADVAGPISDVKVVGIFGSVSNAATTHAAILKLLAGLNYPLRDVDVDGVYGSSLGAPVKIGDDGSGASTIGSDISGVTVRNIGARTVGTSGGNPHSLVEFSAGTGSNIRDVNLENLTWAQGNGSGAGSHASVIVLTATSGTPTLGLIRVKNLTVRGTCDFLDYFNVGASVTLSRIEIDGLYVETAGNSCLGLRVTGVASACASASLKRVKAAFSGSGDLVEIGTTLNRLTIEDSEVLSGNVMVNIITQTAALCVMRFSNVYCAASQLIKAGSPFEVDLNGVDFEGSLTIIAAAFAGATGNIIRGGAIRNALNRAGFSNAGGGSTRCLNPGYPLDVSLLTTPTAGDVAFNTNAAVSPFVTGPCVYDGAAWRPIKTFMASGTATLVAGTKVVNDAKITANSIIRLYTRTPGGTPGAVWVSALTAATSFAITSTNAGDTSVIYYEIEAY